MPSEPLSGVGETAIGAAMMRAQESARSDRLFDDPYAEAFVAAAPSVFADEPTGADADALAELEAAFNAQVVVRTRFFDDYLLAACATDCRQVVLLAAGLDARAFRLSWPTGVRVFELDLPGVLAFKGGVLSDRGAALRCERVAVPVDLREDWAGALTDAGFDRRRSTAWLAEGLLVYLSSDEATQLLTVVGDLSASDSQLSFDHADSECFDRARAVTAMDDVTALWQGGTRGDAAGWLRDHGWHIDTHDGESIAVALGRQVPSGATDTFVVGRRLSR